MTASDFGSRAARAAARPSPAETPARPAPSKKRLTIDLVDPDEYEALRRWAFDVDLPMTKLLRAGAVVAATDPATRARVEAAARELNH